MAFLGQGPVGSKIIVDNECFQQERILNTSVVKFPMKMEKIFNRHLKDFSQVLGILNNTFKPNLAQKFLKIKAYNALSLPIPLYGSEIWTLRKKN